MFLTDVKKPPKRIILTSIDTKVWMILLVSHRFEPWWALHPVLEGRLQMQFATQDTPRRISELHFAKVRSISINCTMRPRLRRSRTLFVWPEQVRGWFRQTRCGSIESRETAVQLCHFLAFISEKLGKGNDTHVSFGKVLYYNIFFNSF